MPDVPGLEKGARTPMEGVFKMLMAAGKNQDIKEMLLHDIPSSISDGEQPGARAGLGVRGWH